MVHNHSMLTNKNNQHGYTLLEVSLGLTLAFVLFATTATLYRSFVLGNTRQQRVIDIENQLNFVLQKLTQSIVSLPARNLNNFSGLNYSVAQLPANGTVNGNNNAAGIQLFPVTPYKVNGHDALTLIYARKDAPRLELIETASFTGGQGIIRVALSDPTLINSLTVNTLMMVVGTPPIAVIPGNADTTRAVGRIVRIISTPSITQAGEPARSVLQFVVDSCQSGPCSTAFPQLINTTKQESFAAGSAVIPINLVSFYLTKEFGGSLIVRNDGGTITFGQNGQAVITGGRESNIGESDTLKFEYLLKDGSIKASPDSPMVPWLDQVKSVRTSISRTMPSPISTGDILTKSVTADLPIAARGLD